MQVLEDVTALFIEEYVGNTLSVVLMDDRYLEDGKVSVQVYTLDAQQQQQPLVVSSRHQHHMDPRSSIPRQQTAASGLTMTLSCRISYRYSTNANDSTAGTAAITHTFLAQTVEDAFRTSNSRYVYRTRLADAHADLFGALEDVAVTVPDAAGDGGGGTTEGGSGNGDADDDTSASNNNSNGNGNNGNGNDDLLSGSNVTAVVIIGAASLVSIVMIGVLCRRMLSHASANGNTATSRNSHGNSKSNTNSHSHSHSHSHSNSQSRSQQQQQQQRSHASSAAQYTANNNNINNSISQVQVSTYIQIDEEAADDISTLGEPYLARHNHALDLDDVDDDDDGGTMDSLFLDSIVLPKHHQHAAVHDVYHRVYGFSSGTGTVVTGMGADSSLCPTAASVSATVNSAAAMTMSTPTPSSYSNANSNPNSTASTSCTAARMQQRRSRVRQCTLTVHAPPGKLGIIIDTPNNHSTNSNSSTDSNANPPIVHAIKDSSPLNDDLCVGDRIVEFNGVDTRNCSAMQLTKLIALSNDNYEEEGRVFVVQRFVVLPHDEEEDGGAAGSENGGKENCSSNVS